MEYAIDKKDKTNKVHYSNAHYNGKEYLCPHCFEPVFLKSNCFSHEPIQNRTPIQRACPEYHPGADVHDVISNPVDRLYVYNGGIPLYLCGDGIFELRAYIKVISDNVLNKLKQMEVKLHINTNAPLKSDEKVYSIDNLSYYKVDTLQKWIEIKCLPDQFIDEDIRRKWLLGIRGIDEKDIYHSNKNGGYRVSIKGSIIIGSHYRILSRSKTSPSVNGIIFDKIGTINLKEFNGITYSIIVYDVYAMQVIEYTEESAAFIETKDYQLETQKDELIPLWPPAVVVGNQLTYNSKNAIFLHLKSSNKEFVFTTEKNHIQLLKAKNNLMANANIITIPINEPKAVWFSQNDEPTAEIKFQIEHSKLITKYQSLKKELNFTDNIAFSNKCTF